MDNIGRSIIILGIITVIIGIMVSIGGKFGLEKHSKYNKENSLII